MNSIYIPRESVDFLPHTIAVMNTEKKISSMAVFVWDGGNASCTLYDRTEEEAVKVAREFGWSERCWYKPSTWGNVKTYEVYETPLDSNQA